MRTSVRYRLVLAGNADGECLEHLVDHHGVDQLTAALCVLQCKLIRLLACEAFAL